MNRIIKINKLDNVAVCLTDVVKGDTLRVGDIKIIARQNIQKNHKIALLDIAKGEQVLKYGNPIGIALQDIKAGDFVHIHNLKTGLGKRETYTYEPSEKAAVKADDLEDTFAGFVREDGRVGIRNEIWVINTVGCINKSAEIIAQKANAKYAKRVDAVSSFPHPYGCSQLGEDHENTQKIIANMVRHPNAAGVLVLGLGCENNNIAVLKEVIGEINPDRVKFLEIQQVDDEYAMADKLIGELVNFAERFKRQPCPISKLVVGLKCGGSDALSGVTANPLLGAFSDMLLAKGGTSILTEVPEMFGAERLLMNRCENEEIFDRYVELINSFKQYYTSHNQPIYENPSPGNKAGGISTLEEKSLGCVQKGGCGIIVDVLRYGDMVSKHGLNILEGPGNDLVSSTNLAAAGAHIVLFSTGRGTPFGTFVPTMKVSTNSDLCHKKAQWIDFDAGVLLEEALDDVVKRFFSYIVNVASGEIFTQNEQKGFKEISIFKNGVTL